MMKFKTGVFLMALGLLTSCGAFNTENSVSRDGQKYVPSDEAGLTPAQVRFVRAVKVFKTNCLECHAGLSNPDETYYLTSRSSSVGDFLAVPGKLEESALWRVLRGAGATAYMPPSFQLQQGEIDQIRDWITNLAPPARQSETWAWPIPFN